MGVGNKLNLNMLSLNSTVLNNKKNFFVCIVFTYPNVPELKILWNLRKNVYYKIQHFTQEFLTSSKTISLMVTSLMEFESLTGRYSLSLHLLLLCARRSMWKMNVWAFHFYFLTIWNISFCFLLEYNLYYI